jgi:hypothetical protein
VIRSETTHPHAFARPDDFSRRAFLETAGLATAAAAVAITPGALGQATATAAGDNVFERPLRWVQLTLTERHPATCDLT